MNSLDFSLSAEQRELTEATAAYGREDGGHRATWCRGVVEFREALPRTSTRTLDRVGLAQKQHKPETSGGISASRHT
jgi:hypothetical protein